MPRLPCWRWPPRRRRPRNWSDRRETCLELLRTGRPAVLEEAVTGGAAKQVFLTSHRPVRIADRNLLLSSSADITEQKAVEDHLFRSAYYDELTGLPTRRVIEHRVNSLLKHDERTGPFRAGVSRHRQFQAHQRLLRPRGRRRAAGGDGQAAGAGPARIRHPVADQRRRIRAAAQPDPERAPRSRNIIHFILQRLKAPFFIDESEIFASTSIGVSLYPEHGRSYDVLRQNADIAMYRVKNGGKGAAAFFDASMEREALARMKIEQSLRLAILEKRFCCAFQAKVDIRTQEIMGIEALVRLRDDEGVIQAPGTFINLAIELGLIDELTHLVLAEIVKSIDLINETFGPDTTISINVAAKQAGNPRIHAAVRARRSRRPDFPARFMIEVTEDAFVTKTHFQDEILPIFRKLGVGISIDDFGIGYSSLSALADITADEIKIDRSFITDIHKRPRSQGILRAIESLSEALGMTVIAEGRRNLRGTGLSAGRDQDPLRAGLLLLQADLPGRTQAGDPARQRRARRPGEPAGAGKPPGLFARRRLSPLTVGRLPRTGASSPPTEQQKQQNTAWSRDRAGRTGD